MTEPTVQECYYVLAARVSALESLVENKPKYLMKFIENLQANPLVRQEIKDDICKALDVDPNFRFTTDSDGGVTVL